MMPMSASSGLMPTLCAKTSRVIPRWVLRWIKRRSPFDAYSTLEGSNGRFEFRVISKHFGGVEPLLDTVPGILGIVGKSGRDFPESPNWFHFGEVHGFTRIQLF